MVETDAHLPQAFPIMIRKIHEFLIEADVTVEEWMAACNLMVQAGKVSSDQRNEVVLVTDVFGIESLVGEYVALMQVAELMSSYAIIRHSRSNAASTKSQGGFLARSDD